VDISNQRLHNKSWMYTIHFIKAVTFLCLKMVKTVFTVKYLNKILFLTANTGTEDNMARATAELGWSRAAP
jgi:hypothetical protein